MRDKVVIAIYKLGNNGKRSVDARQLEQEGGFSKVEISQAIKMANEQGWIYNMSTHDGMAWALKPKAIYYVKGLLGE
jgi:predicted transcriptional regulator